MNATASIEHALALHRGGDLAGAEEVYGHILRDDPDDVSALQLMGVICTQRGSWRDGEQYLRRCLAIAPGYAAAHGNLGLVLARTGRVDEALVSLRRSVVLDPAQPGVWSNLGMVLTRAGRYAEAVHACETALAHAPDSAEALCNLANALRGNGDLQAALDAANRAVTCRPAFPEALNALGNILADLGRTGEAIVAYNRAVECGPGYLSPMNNLAKIHRECGDLEQARAGYERVLERDPACAEAHWGIAFVHLLAGNLAEGWKEYGWRWRLETAPDRRSFPSPRWDGAVRTGQTLLLVCEQGLGDALQFIRYASTLRRSGVRVIVEAPDPLVRLFRGMDVIEQVIPRGSSLPAHDAHCHLLDLPHVCGTVLTSIPADVPYVRATDKSDRWATRIAADPAGVRIGICWKGSAGHIDDRRRSCDPRLLSTLATVPGVVLYNVQQGLAPESVPDAIRNVWVDHSAAFDDVAATAGLLARLDLVITVDTMVAHLAGAMGIPVWVLLPRAPDWRWMMGRVDSPWYPTMRLFRQHGAGGWEGVVADILSALVPFVADRTVKGSRSPVVTAVPADVSVEEGIRSHEAGDLTAAEACYRHVLMTRPDDTEALYLLSVICHQTGRATEGIGIAHQLLTHNPDHPEGWNSLGNLEHDEGRYVDAERAFRRALALRPTYGEALYNLGRSLCEQWRLNEAHACFTDALACGIPAVLAHTNIGLVRLRQGRMAEAIASCEHAIALDGGCVDAHWNLAHALLQTGAIHRGWQEYEWRWARPLFRNLRERQQMPGWDGTSMPGRTILLWAEQGLGDVIHALRYLPAVAARGLRIVVECPAALVRTVNALEHVHQAVAQGTYTPAHDVQCALLSLPVVLGDHEEPFPTIPTMNVDDVIRGGWERRLAQYGTAMRVGIVWAGSRTNVAGAYRSIPLDVLSRIGDVPGVVFVSLQKDAPAGAFAGSGCGAHGVDWADELTDFADTAALIAALDVVITIDTAVAHCAGALGKETWLLLSKHHDWRWGTGEDTTPWYPSFRLIRQARQGVWDDVVERCRMMLSARCSFEGSANAGVVALYQGRPAEAIRDLTRAVDIVPDHVGAHFDLALALLGAGAWERGFAEYEWRLRMESGHASARPYAQPRWTGEPLEGRTIFVYAEQGFGDAIQFVRYATLLRARGARVIVECRRELASLFACADGVDAVLVRGDAPPPFDVHTPMLSIPGIVGTVPSTVPAEIPYIHLPAAMLAQPPAILQDIPAGLKVGVVWSGNAVSAIDRERSVGRDALLRALPAQGVTYVSMQVGGMAGEVWTGPQRMIDAGPAISNFLDTAHLIAHLDLVISVDTAAAHLAGALGRPVITMLPVHADWRWLTGTETTPWYPTMILRRQTSRGAWGDVIRHVVADLHRKREHHDQQ